METSKEWDEIQPFTGEMPVAETPAVLAETAAQREVAAVQAQMAIAKRFPRNQKKAMDRILVACQRPSLAEKALYSYARGGTEITGPSIRLAEAIVQQWGNVDFGIKELEQRMGESTVEAYAWDLETNTRQAKTFQVKHTRYTRQGTKTLTDPRDIYEMVANLGARRLRACILGIIPGDVVDAAQEQCESTMKAKSDISPEAVQRMVKVFGELGVSKEMIENRIQRKIDSITSAQVISLRKIYNSLRDGMSQTNDWFDVTPQDEGVAEPIKATRRGRKPKEVLVQEPPAPEPESPATDATEGQGPDLKELLDALEPKGWPVEKLQVKFGKSIHAWGPKEYSILADMAASE